MAICCKTNEVSSFFHLPTSNALSLEKKSARKKDYLRTAFGSSHLSNMIKIPEKSQFATKNVADACLFIENRRECRRPHIFQSNPLLSISVNRQKTQKEAPTNNIPPEARIDYISNNNGKRSNPSTGERPQRQDGRRGVQDARRYRTKLDAQGCPTILCVCRQVLRQGGDERTCRVLGVLYPKLPGPLSAIQQFDPTSKNEMPTVCPRCTIVKTLIS